MTGHKNLAGQVDQEEFGEKIQIQIHFQEHHVIGPGDMAEVDLQELVSSVRMPTLRIERTNVNSDSDTSGSHSNAAKRGAGKFKSRGGGRGGGARK